MALILLSGGIGSIKGKQGGNIYQGSKFGQMIRTNKTGKANQSLKFRSAQSFLARTSQEWQTLTRPQQVAWNLAASSVTRLNKFGNPYNPSGFQYYVELNNVVFPTTGTFLTAPPPAAILPIWNINSLTFPTTTTLEIDIAGSVSGDYELRIYATRPYPAGQFPSRPSYRYIESLQFVSSNVFNISSNYNLNFGAIPSRCNIFVKCVASNFMEGHRSSFQYTNVSQ